MLNEVLMVKPIDLTPKEPFFTEFGFEKTQLLLEKVPFVVIVLDAEEKIQYLNATGEQVYQCLIEDALGRTLPSLLFVSDMEPIEAALRTAFQEGKVVYNLRWNEEQYYDGRLFWKEATFHPVQDDAGAVQHVVVTINDITGHVREQKRLQRGQEQYRMMFECAPEGIVILERYYIRGANTAWEQMTGYKQEEVIGKRIDEVSPTHQPSGEESDEMLETLIDKALEGDRQSFEWQWKNKSGEIINSHVTLGDMNNFSNPEQISLVQAIVRQQ